MKYEAASGGLSGLPPLGLNELEQQDRRQVPQATEWDWRIREGDRHDCPSSFRRYRLTQVHRHQKFVVRFRAAQTADKQFHRFDRIHVIQNSAQQPDSA